MRPAPRCSLPLRRPARSWGGLLLLAAGLHSAPASAQQPRQLESVLSFKTVKVADGIYAFITPEERSGFQAGNSIAVIGDDGVLVIDTGNLPSSTRRQIAELRKLTSLPVRYVVNTHWHPDHNLGNAEYRAAFPGVTIVGTTATRDGIIARVPVYFGQMKGFLPTDSVLRLRLSTGKTRDGTPLSEAQRVMWRIDVDDFAEFYPEVLTAKAEPPTLLVDDSLTLTLGRREVKVISLGRGNTAGDSFVYVPDAKALITGDLLTMPCPFPGTAFFGDWVRDLDYLKRLDAAVIVPGHGDVQHDYQYLDLVRELLVYTRAQARAAVKDGLGFDEALKRVSFADFIPRFSGGDLVRTDAFNSFYVFAAVQRAYDEARYLAEGFLPRAP
jgi:glyoxylase-like metal-dependent hydrolase (beta-lactamase superfamily II)